MKISENQIKELHNFTRKHFVECYDVQTELVDHLTNGIESQWEENPKLFFKDALNIEFKKFGIFGFQEVLESRVRALNIYYWKSIWNIFKTYFSLPKLLLTIALFCVTYTVFSLAWHVGHTLSAILILF
ncbi:hypothetical protein KO493_02700, partial [Tamlana agarivorans]|nr:hypothetical protein [Tamlana agarivorans]